MSTSDNFDWTPQLLTVFDKASAEIEPLRKGKAKTVMFRNDKMGIAKAIGILMGEKLGLDGPVAETAVARELARRAQLKRRADKKHAREAACVPEARSDAPANPVLSSQSSTGFVRPGEYTYNNN